MAPSPEPFRHSFTLRIDLAEVSRARRLIAELADEAGFAEERRFDIQVASSEACANAIEHSPAEAEVELEVLTYLDRLEVRVEGSGQFELPAIAARGRMSRGLGLPLMAKLSDHLALYSGPRGGTLVALTFYRPGFRDKHPDDVTPPSFAELLEENELVTAILGSITDEVWFADTQERFTLANAAAFAEFGAASSEGTAVAELAAATEVYRADMTPRPVDEAPPLRALAGEVVKNQEEVVRTPASAGLRHRLVNAAPVRDVSGEIVGAVSVVRDITEHRKAEEALAESEKLYRSLFTSMKEAFFVGDVITDGAGRAVDYRIVEANSATEAQTGVPLEHYIGNTALTMYPDLDAFWVDTYGRVGLTGEPARFDNYVPQQDRHYEVVAYQVRPGRFAAVFTDITERKAVEHEIRDLSRRLTHHIEHSPLAVIEWGPDMRLVRWSGEAERMFGWQADEVLGKRIEDFRWVYEGDEAQVAEVSTELQDGTNPRCFSVNRNYRKDGSVIDCEWYNSSLLDEAGRLQSILSLVVDVSARKRAEEALRKSEGSLAEAQHIGHIGSWEWNIQTGEVSWSAELYSIYQVNPDTFVPSIQALGDYIYPDDRGVVDGIIRQILSGSAPGSFDFRIVLADGSIRYLSTTGQITEYDEAGRPRLMVGVNQDVTERKLAEKTLLRLNRTLAAHSASDQALIRALDESRYLAEVCRIVVEDCGHAMVWIGYKEDNDDKSIRPVASAGFGEGYLETLNITWADGERGRGPTGMAVRTGRPSRCRNMLTDPAFAPWRDEAVSRGYASSVALPLLQNGTTFGAIMIYSSEPDPFSDDEVKLLADLTDDLALGITTLRLRTAHAEAEREREILLAEEQELAEELRAMNKELQTQAAELAARERQLREQNEELRASRYNRTLIEASLDPLVTIGLDGTITDVNEATVEISGYSRDELIGTDFADYFTDPESARGGYREVFTNGSVTDYPLTVRARDGRLTDVLYNATVYKDQEGKVLGVFAAARDMTAIKELEEQRAIADALQEALLDLPRRAPGVEFGHLYRSATQRAQVGGDFYDVFEAKGGRIAILIGDVSGHGLEAARIATLAKDIVHAFSHQFRRPYLVLRETNRFLVKKNLPGFVTAFLGFLDPMSGALVYSSAGHPPPLLSTEGQVEPLSLGGMPLGVFADARYRDIETEIQRGSLILLYTDGITETRQDGNLFGEQRLAEALGRMRDEPVDRLPSLLLAEALDFSDGTLQDDVALLAINYLTAAGD